MARCFLKWSEMYAGLGRILFKILNYFIYFIKLCLKHNTGNVILLYFKTKVNYLLFTFNFVTKSIDNVDEIDSRTIKEIIFNFILID